MTVERILIPGEEENKPLGPDQILVLNNQKREGGAITLKEAKKRSDDIFGLLSTFKDIPINNLSYEANPATCEVGWHAPKGYSFKIEGKFYIMQTSLIKEGWENYAPPTSSKSQFIEDHKKIFSNFLIITKGNEKRALKLLIEEVEDWEGEGAVDFLPVSFIGKWLFIESAEGKSVGLRDIPKDVRIKVATEAEIRENDDFSEELQIENKGKSTMTRTVFPSGPRIDGVQSYAEAIPGECKIALVKRKEKKRKLLVAEQRPILIRPLWSIDEPLEQEKTKSGDVQF